MQMSGGQAGAAFCGAGLPPSPEVPRLPGKTMPLRLGRPGRGPAARPGWQPRERSPCGGGRAPGPSDSQVLRTSGRRRRGAGRAPPGLGGSPGPGSPRLQVVRKVSRNLAPALGKRRTKPEKRRGGHREGGS